MTDGPRKRDFLDILDVFAKVTASMLLAVLAFVIPSASQRIAASLDTGRLVQALIGDLTTSDQQTRQDLALIALNRSVGDNNSALVAEIAERLYFDLSTRDTDRQDIGRVAFAVLTSRDPERAQLVRDSLEQEANTARLQIVSPASADDVGRMSSSSSAQLISRIHSSVAYIQFGSPQDSTAAESLRGALTKADFWTPAVDRVEGSFRNWIRYFHDADEPLARRAQEVVERYFAGQGTPQSFRVQSFTKSGFQAPEGQIEVWLRLVQ